MMANFSLLLTAILTGVVSAGAAPIYCSDVQSSASGSHNTDLSQVISLQYCIIDNCTIMKIDTGEQLDIVYTTESLLIVTPINGLISMAITKIDNELPCMKYHSKTDGNQILFHQSVGSLAFALIIMMTSVYILIVHLLYKKLHTLFGKLLIFHNLFILSGVICYIALLFTHHWIILNSQTICHTVMIFYLMSTTGVELFSTTILTHLAYTMYRCYWLKPEISTKNKKQLFRYYTAYVFITLVLLFFLIIAYDWRTENGRYTLLPNGHCNFINQFSYSIQYLVEVINMVNKIAHIVIFIVYLIYFYKLKADFREAPNLVQYS